jgi:hypothetical protein
MPIKNFLIVYNWRESRLDHWRDIDRELKSQGLGPEQARDLYREYEQRFTQSDGYEVVLIGSDSIDTIRKTHAHYFGELPDNPFSELL